MAKDNPKVSKSFRLDANIIARVAAQKKPNEPEVKAFERVLTAGLFVLENKVSTEKAETVNHEAVAILQSEVDFLREQLTAKDQMINDLLSANKGLTAATQQAQALHAMETAIQPTPTSERRGIFARLFGKK